jgi:hypothetical protein
MTKAELSRVASLKPETDSPLVYTIATVPKPHVRFESYVVMVSETIGLCKVVAVGKSIETSAFGTELHSEFDNLEASLEQRYGKHKTFDHLRAGSLWTEPQYWMMGLEKKDRTLAAFWDHEETPSLPTDLNGIMLQAQSLNTSKGYLSLTYEFSNMDTCSKESDALRDAGL